MSGLLIVGAGGHGKVVADTASCNGSWDKVAFLDDRFPSFRQVLNWPVLGSIAQAPSFLEDYPDLTVAIGNNPLRVKLLRRFAELGFRLPGIVHPSAYLSETAVLGSGSVVLPQCAVNAGAVIGFGCIINTGATIDHECVLGEGVHISPGAHLGGEVTIGDFSWLGIGSSVIQQITIGKNVVIGAGTVIIKNIPDNVKVYGVPGRVVKKNEVFA